jgi:DNA-binding MarR family transcriptional regulator
MPTKKHLDTLLEIKDNPSLSQRSLAHKLNISLGLTNAIIKNLISRGWVKAKKDTGRKLLYIITPKGMANVSSLMYNRFQETLNYYHYTKDLLTAYLMKLYKQGERTVNIYGSGQLAEITYYAGISTPLKLNAIITDDPSSSKKKFLGREVLTLSDFIKKYSQQLSEKSQKKMVIISTINRGKLQQELKKHKNIKDNLKIINLEEILKNLKT